MVTHSFGDTTHEYGLYSALASTRSVYTTQFYSQGPLSNIEINDVGIRFIATTFRGDTVGIEMSVHLRLQHHDSVQLKTMQIRYSRVVNTISGDMQRCSRSRNALLSLHKKSSGDEIRVSMAYLHQDQYNMPRSKRIV